MAIDVWLRPIFVEIYLILFPSLCIFNKNSSAFFVHLLLALGCLVACTPKKTAYEQYVEMYNALDAQLQNIEDRAVRDSLIDDFVADGYTLIMENVEDVTSDSIVLSHFYMLTPEQKAELIAAIPVERWEKPLLKLVYKEYRIAMGSTKW